MKIRLLDWADIEHIIEIPDDTELIEGEVISGDMVMYEPFFYDTGKETRIYDFHDGRFVVLKEDFEKLNSLLRSNDVFDIKYETKD